MQLWRRSSSAAVVKIVDCVRYPVGIPPILILGAHFRLECLLHVGDTPALRLHLLHAVADKQKIIAHGSDKARIANFAMTRHYNCGIEFLQALEHPDPVCAACVRIGHDGGEAVYHHVPAEQNALLGKKNTFITTGVCWSPVD